MENVKEGNKRKKIVLTIKQKLRLIERFENGESALKLAKEYGLGTQTVRDIVKQKKKLEAFTRYCDSTGGPSERKSMKMSSYEDLDSAMLMWFNQKRAEGVTISWQMYIKKGKYFHEKLGLEGKFSASSGWLSRFKQRYGIRELTLQGELLSDSVKAADKFCIEFQEYLQLENLELDQIYNAGKIDLYWKSLPTKKKLVSSRGKSKSASKHKSSDECITVMCCGNASGTHKMKLLVVGKAKNPLSLQETEIKNFPVHYYYQKEAWMDEEIFEDWFKTKWVPEVREFLISKGLPQKAVLLIDNVPSHLDESILKTDNGLMVAKFLPNNVTSLIQPMDQGVISSLKRFYRMALLKTLVEEDKDLKKFREKMTIDDAIHEITQSWLKVDPEILVRSWRKILPNMETDLLDSVKTEAINISEIYRLIKKIKGFENVDRKIIKEWFDMDSNDPDAVANVECMNDTDNVSVVSQTEEEESDNGNKSREDTKTYISNKRALTSVQILLDYVDQRGFEYEDKVALRKIRTSIKLLRFKKKKRFTDLFNKKKKS